MKVFSYVTGVLLLVNGWAHAANLIGVDDNYGIPIELFLQVEPFGVLNNDMLDGENAGESGLVTATLVSGVSNGTLTCPGVGPGLCADGSFEYTPGAGFNGFDTFVYQATSATETTPAITVTLSGCSGGPQYFSCWNENAYLAKLAELGYSTFQEGFEASVWDSARTTTGSVNSVNSLTSQGITWTSNHITTNNITTGSGPARSGNWGVFDYDHGYSTGTLAQCNVVTPPPICLYHDGFSGSIVPGLDALHGIGGYTTGFYISQLSIILDGTTQFEFGLQESGFKFIGIIDASLAGFTSFEFRELDGVVGQALYIFGDDFTITGTALVPDGDLAPLGNPDGLINVADYLIAQRIALGELTATPLELAHGDVFPVGDPDGVINTSDLLVLLDMIQN